MRRFDIPTKTLIPITLFFLLALLQVNQGIMALSGNTTHQKGLKEKSTTPDNLIVMDSKKMAVDASAQPIICIRTSTNGLLIDWNIIF